MFFPSRDDPAVQHTRALIEQRFGPPPTAIARERVRLRFLQPRLRIDPDAMDEESLRERSIIRFATFQFFFEIFLQKFGIGPATGTMVGVSLVLAMVTTGYMLVQRKISFSPLRLGLFMLFVFCTFVSQIQVAGPTSAPSLGQVLVIYAFMTISAPLSEAGYFKLCKRFIWMMTIPAAIGLLQYGIQLVNGGGDPIGMDKVVPAQFLIKGFFYDAHYPRWNDPFQRPNGFFFLEPSFFSYFLACATIIEATYFRRPLMFAFLVLSTVASTGGTGISMFLVVFPILLVRESPKMVISVVTIAIIGLIAALILGIHLPLISRLGELDQDGVGTSFTSGSNRLVLPFNKLIETLSDPSFIFGGMGAGSTNMGEMGSAWPILKLTYEYGMLSMISFMVLFFVSVFSSNYNMPYAIAVLFVFHVTGAYLHDDVSVIPFTFLLTIVAPVRKKREAVSSNLIYQTMARAR